MFWQHSSGDVTLAGSRCSVRQLATIFDPTATSMSWWNSKAGTCPASTSLTIERELSELVGHNVDLITPKFLIPRIRDHVLTSIQVLYTAP